MSFAFVDGLRRLIWYVFVLDKAMCLHVEKWNVMDDNEGSKTTAKDLAVPLYCCTLCFKTVFSCYVNKSYKNRYMVMIASFLQFQEQKCDKKHAMKETEELVYYYILLGMHKVVVLENLETKHFPFERLVMERDNLKKN